MRAHVLIGFLFVCAVTAHPVADDVAEEAEESVMPGSDNPFMYVMNDNDDFIQIDMDDDDPETEEETKRELATRVLFYLHIVNNQVIGEQLFLGDKEALAASGFNPDKPTKFITHGWVNSKNSAACSLIRDAYLQHGDYNVIVIDWSLITYKPYLWTARRVEMVAEYVTKMIDFLVAEGGLDLARVTMVGHSLGAHVMGLSARNAKGTVNYVVGLDPALPAFMLAEPGSRISSGDAKYVEIIHTNAGLLGYKSPIGDVDFYPNGGSKQPGCILDFGGACSHARAFRFFAESINSSKGFHGYHCHDWLHFKAGYCTESNSAVMGGYKEDFTAVGTYFLETRHTPPYAKGSI